MTNDSLTDNNHQKRRCTHEQEDCYISGDHYMPLDNCVTAMKQTGLEISPK